MILAFGDTHRDQASLDRIVEIIRAQQPLAFIHTGDNYPDFQWLKRQTKVEGYGVKGNCDGFWSGAKEELCFNFNSKKILLTHGHRHRVKESHNLLAEYARDLAADVVVFGHTHVQYALREQGLWLINPGSMPLPRDGKPGYARIEVWEPGIDVELITF